MLNFKFKLNPPADEIRTCCTVLNGIANRYHVGAYQTTLSLKAVVRGAALYRTPQAKHLVTDDCFLILNEGQKYSLDFQWPGATETICLFFQPGFMENASYASVAPTVRQLDDPEASAKSFGLCECLHSRSGRIARLLRQLHLGVRGGAGAMWLEDRFYEVAQAIVALSVKAARSTEQIPALRAATREELYRRLHRGRDYLSSSYDSTVTVASAARAAKLSPAHFHRQFKTLFRQTPMQFLQERRLASAGRLLKSTDEPVTNVCFLSGFESLGSFCSLFRKRFGCSPSQYRNRQEVAN